MPQVAAPQPKAGFPDHVEAPTAAFGGIAVGYAPDGRGQVDFQAVHDSEAFDVLRTRFRRFAFPVAVLAFVWYLAYVLLAAYAHGFMSARVIGLVNVGLLLGFAQFATTIAITAYYLRYARTRLDPQVELIRDTAGVSPR